MTKILVSRFSSIGDIVLTSPIIRCLKQQIPNCNLSYVTKLQYSPLVKYSPYIDNLYFLEDDLSKLVNQLKVHEFDYLIDLHKNLRTRHLKHGLNAQYSSFNKLNIRKWLLVNLKQNFMPDKHIVDRYFEAAASLGVSYDGKGLDLFMPKQLSLPKLEKEYLVFAMGGTYATKRLTREKSLELCMKFNLPVYLIGGEDVSEEASFLDNSLEQVKNLTGKLSLEQSAKIIEGAKKVISHDSGMMHIAAALNKDIISVWGNTVSSFGMSPFYADDSKARNLMIENKDLSCRPCSKLGYDSCPKGHFKCIKELDFSIIG